MAYPETHTTSKDIWRTHLAPLLLLTLATLLTFAPSLGHEFVTEWDDGVYVLRNSVVWGSPLDNLHLAFTNYFGGNYAPLQIVSYILDKTLWGFRPAGFIATNLLLHLANGLLYYLLIWRMTARRGWSFAAAAIFLLHPVQVESAVWVSQRKNVLAMFFFLLAILLYLQYKRDSRGKGLIGYAGSIAAFLGAIFSKSVVVILPLVLLAHDFCFLERKNRGRWIVDKIPYLLLSAAFGLLAIRSQSHEMGGGIYKWHGGSPLATFYTMLTVMVHYLELLLWPTHLSSLYDYPAKTSIDFEVASSGILLLTLAGGACYLARRNRQMFFWASLIILGILPVSQIIPLVTMMNDRYLYFPMLGVAALTIGVIDDRWTNSVSLKTRIIIPVMTIVVLATLSVLSVNRAKVWQNSLTLFADAHAKFPNNPIPCAILGNIYMNGGQLEEARNYFLQAYQLGMKTEDVVRNLGTIYLSLGDLDQAGLYIKALTTKAPHYKPGLMLLGDYLRRIGDEAGAAEAYKRAVTVK